MMQDTVNPAVATLENQITERYGLLLSHTQLAKLLGRTPGGLRYSLSYPSDQQTYALKICGCKIGRRVYYPAAEVARIIIGVRQQAAFRRTGGRFIIPIPEVRVM